MVKARARKRKVKARTRRVRMTRARARAGRTEPRTAVTRVKTPRTALRVTAKLAEDLRKATAAGRPCVDKSKKVTALQTTDETPPVASCDFNPGVSGALCLLFDRLGVCSDGLPA